MTEDEKLIGALEREAGGSNDYALARAATQAIATIRRLSSRVADLEGALGEFVALDGIIEADTLDGATLIEGAMAVARSLLTEEKANG